MSLFFLVFFLTISCETSLFLNRFFFPTSLVVAYFLAPIPNMICARCNHGYEQTYGNGFKNVGFFLTGFFIVSGFALPGLLAHINLIPPQSLFMGLAGGLVVYGTIMTYLHCFHKQNEEVHTPW
eukprot:TRINITY_DN1403_c0_g1_i1.p1 TRINITY_DN1403_c0_g1~~TRINITY_DN1403_c0_g1_i1.p1  ORF type:complete len:124 (-),score=10.57 TRINITY_DN1403_c0_g1_i1:105-476(-)